MAYNKRATGTRYEKFAGAYLEKQGYQILEYNYRCKMGEIDLIAKDGEYLVFCEVKYRSGTGSGYAVEAVDYRKQQIISRCALHYMMVKKITDVPCRFDVVSIQGDAVTLYKNAFDHVG